MNLKEYRKRKVRFLKARKCALVAGEGIIEQLNDIYEINAPVKDSLIRLGKSLNKKYKSIFFKLLGY